MAVARVNEWSKIPISLKELCINTTLRCGQSFRWRKAESGEWNCALHGRILSLRQDDEHLHYRAIFPSNQAPPTPPGSQAGHDEEDSDALIRHYLNLTPDLTKLYSQWSAADKNFAKKAPKFTGVRILRQDAWEALVGFICSSNNNIIRISQMVDKLCTHYGQLIGHIGTQAFYDFPSATALTGNGVEAHLRLLGFGYRAKYLHQTAKMVANERASGWLDGLRNPECPVLGQKAGSAGKMRPEGREGYREAHEQLLALQGVGPKVADCVCLMGLGWGEAVPVDTHVWQIAQRDYKFGKGGKHKSLTKDTYDAVGDHFRALWGQEAGWAHSVLFTADLRAFSEQLAQKIKVESVEEKIKVESVEEKKKKIKVEEEGEGFVSEKTVKVSRARATKRKVEVEGVVQRTSKRGRRR
ncbi:MAG: 8-oxoguanine glycosylase ogg1 [Vezdaea aestivalis]|nr:MAG: 8-oxoguanine glycosylase ogg1 [Vezdaea aestivalis]